MARFKTIAAIDVGSEKTVTLMANLYPDKKISVIGVANIPSKGVRKSQIIDIEAAISAITESIEAAERMAGFNLGNAFISVGGSHINCQNSKGVVAVSEHEGEITQEDIYRVTEAAKAISLPSNREIIHVLPREFIVDGQHGIRDPLGMSGIRLEVETHIITANATANRNLIKCINYPGVDVSGLVFNGLASSMSVLSDTEKELGVVLVDIGAGTTSICVFTESALSYSAVLPIGARNITNDLAIGLRISLESAEKIKISLSQKTPKRYKNIKKEETKKKNDDKELDLRDLELPEGLKSVQKRMVVEGIIKPRLVEIFNLVGEELKKSGLGGATPAGIVITGGAGHTVNIIETARQRLGLPARIGLPSGVSGLIDEIGGAEFASSIGLLLYAASEKEEKKLGLSNLLNFGKITSRVPIKGAVGKVIDLFKTFLP